MLPERIEFAADERFPPGRSVVLRYAPAVLNGRLPPEDLRACSLGEGMRVLDLGGFQGVNLKVLDETSAMASGTYKSLDGCVATALCRREGVRRVVFSSGANGGSALSLYGQSAGLESFFFCPRDNLYKIDGALFARTAAHLIAVEGLDRRVKQAAGLFSEMLDIPLIPPLDWRILSAGCRGLFLAEEILRGGENFTWLVQAVCAGYGPLGIYQAMEGLVRSGRLDRRQVPRFLGVQQAGLCPMVRAWQEGQSSLPPPAMAGWEEPPIEPALYNVYPDQTYPLLRRVLRTWAGDMLAVDQEQFDRYAGEFARRLEGAGLRLTRVVVDGREQFLEKAGLLAGAGALKAVAEGLIAPGETVLCAVTGGAGPAPSRPAPGEHRIGSAEPLEEAVRRLAARYGT